MTESRYHARNLPDFVFTQDYSVKNTALYLKGDLYDTYHYNYSRLVQLLKDGIIIPKTEDMKKEKIPKAKTEFVYMEKSRKPVIIHIKEHKFIQAFKVDQRNWFTKLYHDLFRIQYDYLWNVKVTIFTDDPVTLNAVYNDTHGVEWLASLKKREGCYIVQAVKPLKFEELWNPDGSVIFRKMMVQTYFLTEEKK